MLDSIPLSETENFDGMHIKLNKKPFFTSLLMQRVRENWSKLINSLQEKINVLKDTLNKQKLFKQL